MIKIGILTFHRSVNNGAVMQAYALSKRLQNELKAYDAMVEIIDYHMPKEDEYCKPSFFNSMKGINNILRIKRLYRLMQNPNTYRQQKRRIQVFNDAFKKLPLSEQYIYEDDTRTLFAYINSKYDIVIVGSDAVWNYNVLGFPNPYFLNKSVTVKKYTYAASVFGMNYEEIPKNERKIIADALDSYELICTRDTESELFVEEIGCRLQPIHTCDPTVFLDIDHLPIDQIEVRKKLKNKGFDFKKKTIGVMGSQQMFEMVRRMYGKQYQIVALYNYCVGADVNLYDFTPFEWAYVFQLFDVTFTTFFHGTLVSLRNGTPVVACALTTDYAKKHMTKVEDFLIRVGLRDCYFETDYRIKNIDKVKEKADYFLSHDMGNIIREKMDNEAKSFYPFLERIKKEIDER